MALSRKNGMLLDRCVILPLKYAKDIEQSPMDLSRVRTVQPCERRQKPVDFSLKQLTYCNCFAERCCFKCVRIV